MCVTDDQHHSGPSTSTRTRASAIHSVRVSVQKETVGGWSTTTSLTYAADTHDDTVKITEDGVDFGGYAWGIGAADGGGRCPGASSNGVVTPRLDGAIHLNNSSGVCARMNLRYLTEAGST